MERVPQIFLLAIAARSDREKGQGTDHVCQQVSSLMSRVVKHVC